MRPRIPIPRRSGRLRVPASRRLRVESRVRSGDRSPEACGSPRVGREAIGLARRSASRGRGARHAIAGAWRAGGRSGRRTCPRTGSASRRRRERGRASENPTPPIRSSRFHRAACLVVARVPRSAGAHRDIDDDAIRILERPSHRRARAAPVEPVAVDQPAVERPRVAEIERVRDSEALTDGGADGGVLEWTQGEEEIVGVAPLRPPRGSREGARWSNSRDRSSRPGGCGRKRSVP